MEKKLYRVAYVRQDTGAYTYQYVFAENMGIVEDEFADVMSITPCSFIELPEKL